MHDDVDLPTARLQARLGGGLARHNGLRSIAQRLGSPGFLRLRIGVGRPERGDPRPVADYVLSPFAPEDDVDAIVGRAADAVECLLAEGLEETQQTLQLAAPVRLASASVRLASASARLASAHARRRSGALSALLSR